MQQWPPSMEQAGTNCLGEKSAWVVVAAQVVEVLVEDSEAETLPEGTASYPLPHGSQSPRAHQGSIRAERPL